MLFIHSGMIVRLVLRVAVGIKKNHLPEHCQPFGEVIFMIDAEVSGRCVFRIPQLPVPSVMI